MAKIETYQRQILPPSGSDFPSGSFGAIRQAGIVDQGVADFGKSLTDLSGTLAQLNARQVDAQQALDAHKTLADVQGQIAGIHENNRVAISDPTLFEAKTNEDVNALLAKTAEDQTKGVRQKLAPHFIDLALESKIKAKAMSLSKAVDQAHATDSANADTYKNMAISGIQSGNPDAVNTAVEGYRNTINDFARTGLFGKAYSQERYTNWIKDVEKEQLFHAVLTDPEKNMELIDSPTMYTKLGPDEKNQIIDRAAKVRSEYADSARKMQKQAYEDMVGKTVQDAFQGKVDIQTMNSPEFKGKFTDPADWDKVKRAATEKQVSDPDALNKLTYRINSDPYSLTQNDIVSADGLSLADKTKAITELQRTQEITSRPNYQPARELFNIDFEKQFGKGALVDPEDHARMLRVFHSYIMDQKMDPLAAVEKIRKDYQDNEQAIEAKKAEAQKVAAAQPDGLISNIYHGFGNFLSEFPFGKGDEKFGKNFVSGLQRGNENYMIGLRNYSADFYDRLSKIPGLLDKAAAKISDYTGLAKPEAFQKASEYLKNMAESVAPSMDQVKDHQGFLDKMQQAIPQAASQVLEIGTAGKVLDFPIYMALNDALRESDKGALDAVVAGAKGYLGGKMLNALNYLTPGLRIPTAGGIFAGQAALEGKDIKDVAVSGLTGAGLSAFGGRGGIGPAEVLANAKELGGQISDQYYYLKGRMPWSEKGLALLGNIPAEDLQKMGYAEAVILRAHPELIPEAAKARGAGMYAEGQPTQPIAAQPAPEPVVAPEGQPGQVGAENLQPLQQSAAQKQNQVVKPEEAATNISMVDKAGTGDISTKQTPKPAGGKEINAITVKAYHGSWQPLNEIKDIKEGFFASESEKLAQLYTEPRESQKKLIKTKATTEVGILKAFEKQYGKTKKVNEVYIDLKNPLDITKDTHLPIPFSGENFAPMLDFFKTTPEKLIEAANKAGYKGNTLSEISHNILSYMGAYDRGRSPDITQFLGEYTHEGITPRIKTFIEALGYDGVVFNDKILGEFGYPLEFGKTYVAFHKSQVRIIGQQSAAQQQNQVAKTEKSGTNISMVDKAGTGDISTEQTPKPEGGKEIQKLPPSLKTLADTGKISLSDAQDIQAVAKQNNWSAETVKQFTENAIAGLGVHNKDAESLKQMLVTAKIKEAAYKQDAEKYKQEIADNEKYIQNLYNRLGIKIEGGAPTKIEDVNNLVNQKLKEYGNLKPEELIQKALDEQGLNLTKIDAGIDVKTLMVSAMEAIRETSGTEKTTVSHDELIQQASKEFGTIYDEVMNLKQGTILPTAAKQLAARMKRDQLFREASNIVDLSALNPQDQNLKEIAPVLIVRAGMFGSKMGVSSTEAARMTESGKIPVGRDVPATEEYLRMLKILQSGQISPEQLKMLKDSLQTQEQFDEAAKEMARPVSNRIQSVFLEAWINGLLSNPSTHVTNVFGNLYSTFAGIPERYLASKAHFGNKPGVVDGEAKAMLYGMQMGFWDAIKASGTTWASGTSQFGAGQKVENAAQKNISAQNINNILGKFGVDPMNQTLSNAVDFIGKIWRLPTRSLMTFDEFFKMINYRMELQALAYREAAMKGLSGDEAGKLISELTKSPPVEMRAQAMAYSHEQTYTTEPGPVGKAVLNFTNSVPMAKIIVPFVRTPENLFTYAWDRTPFLSYAHNQVRRDIKAGGASRDMALGKMAFGGMLAGLVATLAAAGYITGGGPTDKDLLKTMKDNGWQPDSIRIGNTYYSYKRLDPVGTLVGMVADSTEIMSNLDDYSAGKLGMSIVLSMKNNLLDKTYLQGIMNILDAIKEPNKQWHTYAKNLAVSVVPAGSGDLARGFDPVIHDTQSILDAMRARVPGFSVGVPAQRNIFGDKILRGGALYNDFLSPVYESKAKHDPVLDEIIKNEISINPPSRSIGGTAPSETDPMARDNPKDGVLLSPKQYDRFSQLAGEGLHQALEKLIAKPLYQHQSDGPDGGKALLIHQTVNTYREQATMKMLKEDTELRASLQKKQGERIQLLRPPGRKAMP